MNMRLAFHRTNDHVLVCCRLQAAAWNQVSLHKRAFLLAAGGGAPEDPCSIDLDPLCNPLDVAV